MKPAGTLTPGQPSTFHGHVYGQSPTIVLSVGHASSPSIEPIGARRLGGRRHQHDVEAAEDPPDVRVQRPLDRVREAQQRAERAPEPHRAAGARVELRVIRHVQLDPLAYPARRSRHEAEADEAVVGIGLLDVVAEALERAREPLDRRAYLPGRASPGASDQGIFVESAIRSRPGSRRGGLGERLRRRRRPVQVLGTVAGEHVEQQRRVVDGARERADDGEAVEGRRERPGRDAPALRLDADEVGPGGGDAHRAGAVGADGGGDEAGGDGGGRAAARSRRGCGRAIHGLRVAPKAGPR